MMIATVIVDNFSLLTTKYWHKYLILSTVRNTLLITDQRGIKRSVLATSALTEPFKN
jgi:hypothetical protein